ncbi:DUF4145 domain-containing protein [Sinorhizobium americanum]|uniref:Uncharacterized protein DUF4145 n=1 Tax=Sinorhizobium americanum TaxID=194963 RepID=A0A4R2BW74_9HYPH|nr:DUF4145 domain-containing protein [Sinorhizobium americanum]TCN30284.1 uncharacterized protein DUF4145 [Sinorhizobium americanum]
MSWWDIAEGSGYDSFGKKALRVDLVQCAFCGELGKFKTHARLENTNTSGKTLHYDTLKCEQCGNNTFVFWAIGSGGLQSFHQLPWPTRTTRWPDHWPDDVGRYWLQATRSIEAANWDAAALMARSAVQLTLRHAQAEGSNLYTEINDLGKKGILPPVMVEWAHEVRVLGNGNAHPMPGEVGTTAADAQAVVEYLNMLLKVVFDLPHQIEKHRARKITKP